jgi:hypothetical protein
MYKRSVPFSTEKWRNVRHVESCRLGGHHIRISWPRLSGKEETELLHTFGTFSGLWFALGFVLAVVVLCVELLLAALALLLETSNNVDRATDVAIRTIVVVVAISGDETVGVILATEGVWSSGKRFGVCQSWSRSEWGENDGPASSVTSW